MSALTVRHEPHGGEGWDELVRLWEGTDGPEGCKVEIIEGIVTVAPPPVNHHNYIASKIHRALLPVLPEGCEVYQTLNVAVPSRVGLYIPDVVVVPDEAALAEGNYVPATAAELVVEITSRSNAVNDRVPKLAGYAGAAIPLYLLIDAFASGGPTITLYGEPKDGHYRVLQAGKFGETFHLPEPFALDLDTAAFPTP
ncbi:Uma2 family endonuclease [Streptomyces sp. NPDC056485]|uniref:Uma2 family endonuclease n=1 Tax=Streptomyces sp. NPDC056485 TaxID=3345834 RepID=UPI003676646C